MSADPTQKSIDELKAAFAENIFKYITQEIGADFDLRIQENDFLTLCELPEMGVTSTGVLEMEFNSVLAYERHSKKQRECDSDDSYDSDESDEAYNAVEKIGDDAYKEFYATPAWKNAVNRFKRDLLKSFREYFESVTVPKLERLVFDKISPDNLVNDTVTITKL